MINFLKKNIPERSISYPSEFCLLSILTPKPKPVLLTKVAMYLNTISVNCYNVVRTEEDENKQKYLQYVDSIIFQEREEKLPNNFIRDCHNYFAFPSFSICFSLFFTE